MIHHVFEPARIEPLLAHEIDQESRIEIAAARAHDQAAAGGQTHAGVD
jgi:hypothetical protein